MFYNKSSSYCSCWAHNVKDAKIQPNLSVFLLKPYRLKKYYFFTKRAISVVAPLRSMRRIWYKPMGNS